MKGMWMAAACLVGLSGCMRTATVRRDDLPGELWMPNAEGSRTTQTRQGTELYCCTELHLAGPVTARRLPEGVGLRFVGHTIDVYLPSPTDGSMVRVESFATSGDEVLTFEEVSPGATAALVLGAVAVVYIVASAITFTRELGEVLNQPPDDQGEE